jgi:hypothetical protein
MNKRRENQHMTQKEGRKDKRKVEERKEDNGLDSKVMLKKKPHFSHEEVSSATHFLNIFTHNKSNKCKALNLHFYWF